MSETANVGPSPKRHPIIALILDNPISAINTAAILFGGGIVWQSNNTRMEKMEERLLTIERSYKEADSDMKALLAEARSRIEMAEGRNAGKIEAISAQVTAASIKLSGIESSVRFLVDNQRRRPTE